MSTVAKPTTTDKTTALDVFGGTNSPPAPLVSTAENTPYIAFAHKNMKAWSNVLQQVGDTPEGTPLLMDTDGKIARLDNMKFWITPLYFQHFSEIDNENAILRSAVGKQPGYTWKEHVETVLLVSTLDGVRAARCTFRTTKCPAARDVIDAINAAGGDDKADVAKWAGQSADHKAAYERINRPWQRVMGTIRLEPKVAKNANPNTGKAMPYVQANAGVSPTTAGMYVELVKYGSDESNAEGFAKLIAEHGKRVAEINGKVK